MDPQQFTTFWRAFQATPLPFLTCFCIIAGATWWFARNLYSERLETLEHRLKLKDDEIAKLEKLNNPSSSTNANAVTDLIRQAAGSASEDSPLLSAKVDTALADGRVFIPQGRIFELIDRFRSETNIAAKQAVQPFIGHWMAVTSVVLNVREKPEHMSVTLDLERVMGCPENVGVGIVTLYFKRNFEELKMLRRGDTLSAVGRLEEVEPHGFTLEECEYVVAHSA